MLKKVVVNRIYCFIILHLLFYVLEVINYHFCLGGVSLKGLFISMNSHTNLFCISSKKITNKITDVVQNVIVISLSGIIEFITSKGISSALRVSSIGVQTQESQQS
jgi:hypothetical protein